MCVRTLLYSLFRTTLVSVTVACATSCAVVWMTGMDKDDLERRPAPAPEHDVHFW